MANSYTPSRCYPLISSAEPVEWGQWQDDSPPVKNPNESKSDLAACGLGAVLRISIGPS